jgi:hypothetical protein
LRGGKMRLFKFRCHDYPWNSEDVYIVAENIHEATKVFTDKKRTYEIDEVEFIHDSVFIQEGKEDAKDKD